MTVSASTWKREMMILNTERVDMYNTDTHGVFLSLCTEVERGTEIVLQMENYIQVDRSVCLHTPKFNK